ncbi:MAG: sialate O-acetylesterase [Clostridia bacterium]|nr:sialate O-acetylesterase [Clostridia bacterium]
MNIQDGINEQQEQIQSFLMIGQSNMAGRGEFGEVEPIRNRLCYMLRMGRWQRMQEPINVDRGIFEAAMHSGIGLGASFADKVANTTQRKVGLIPCADGGTKLGQWMPGEVLYDHALLMTRLAIRSSVLTGILWHQGESDCDSDTGVLSYKEKFMTMITSLRADLGAEDVPVIIGELSENLAERWQMGDRPARLNRIFHEIAEELPLCAVVSAKELTLKSDGLHFDSVSQREFGKRYSEAYIQLLQDK